MDYTKQATSGQIQGGQQSTVCPHCGKCPHCGQSASPYQPSWPYWSQPYWQSPQPGSITYGPTSVQSNVPAQGLGVVTNGQFSIAKDS